MSDRDSDRVRTRAVGWTASVVILAIYGGLALSVDFKTAAVGFQSDEATYYLMAYSLAFDQDLEYRHEDLVRGYREFDSGPAGIFLKRGTDVTGARLTRQPPFFEISGVPDQDASRLYFGKSFIYPLVAAPFVRVFGTNGFLILNALLLWGAFWAVYSFSAARIGSLSALLWAGAFVFASVIPVYVVWTQPEVFNWSVATLAYFLWLHKIVNPDASSPRTVWLRRDWTDLAAAILIGLLTFSKITNILLLVPMALWLLWTRAWRQFLLVTAVTGVVGVAAFGANVASSGEWNYQGGERATCVDKFPLAQPGTGLEVCPERSRSEALGSIIFDPEVFWTNLGANLRYFIVGRNSGLVAYYFPIVFATFMMLAAWRRVPAWQWLLLAGVILQSLLFIVTLPYSYFGGGGTVGNRYFTGVYAAAAFMLPVLASGRWLATPWIVGALFTAKLILTPFQTSIRPGDHAKSGPFKWLPVELTNVNNLPIVTEGDRIRIWYGDTGQGNPGFQIYYLDDNSYLQEADKLSFWTRGESEAEMLIKTDKPYRTMQVLVTAGPVPTTATVSLAGRTSSPMALAAGQSSRLRLSLGPGFPYKMDRAEPAYVWTLRVSSSAGFVPAIVEGSADRRFLGVRVQPIIVE